MHTSARDPQSEHKMRCIRTEDEDELPLAKPFVSSQHLTANMLLDASTFPLSFLMS
jgi:hypothetical protein